MKRLLYLLFLAILFFPISSSAFENEKCRIIYADWDEEHKAVIGQFKFLNTILLAKQGSRAVAYVCVNWDNWQKTWQDFLQPYIDDNPGLDFRWWADPLVMYKDTSGTPSGQKMFLMLSYYPVDGVGIVSLWDAINTYEISVSTIKQNQDLIIWGNECLRINLND